MYNGFPNLFRQSQNFRNYISSVDKTTIKKYIDKIWNCFKESVFIVHLFKAVGVI